jgi:hypothetical protein
MACSIRSRRGGPHHSPRAILEAAHLLRASARSATARHGVNLTFATGRDLPADGSDGLTRLPIPDADDLVFSRREQLAAVRRQGKAMDDRHVPTGVEHEQQSTLALIRLHFRRLGEGHRNAPLTAAGPRAQANLRVGGFRGNGLLDGRASLHLDAVGQVDDVAVLESGLIGR